MRRSTKGMTRNTMLGNQNSVKEVVKEDRFQARMNYEDKQKLLKFCKDNGLSQTDYLINTMVDNGILPESRRPVKTDN
ncbi:hypothetical protein ACLDZ1_16470 [Acinetobacter baumannii]|uniref:hypothetical protein n=2 Tax=Acinetobacter baumannii TaxID=470 RepID=UPI0008DD4491|nr:hypothetical protein [Acinetobacter baumannii]MCE6930721.1 hypothetical protein [Acinetobacter baumannii]MCZ0638442.1 hypothetical protein [Acinetobacter baumannii]MVO43788.1 hypothetical protein [Acinetobacter baumannii]OIB66631.1 hypothetical protein A7L34_12345 [Acinetobacter baumannii]OIF15431.1 hypothetical protein A7L98_09210 [Acinetobacter baumannii]